jgi:hypothetical protein
MKHLDLLPVIRLLKKNRYANCKNDIALTFLSPSGLSFYFKKYAS